MKKVAFISSILFSCIVFNSQSQTISTSTTKIGIDTLKSKAWLIGVIEFYLTSNDLNAAYSKMKSSLTTNYYNYKQDAINLEYDHPGPIMTPEQFKKKWESRYNTKFVGNGGFFISEEDHGKVKVTSCNFIKQPDQNSIFFKVIIEDQTFKKKFYRDIKLVKNGTSFLIDDVIEYN